MYTPCHPGEILREDVIAELELTVTEAAKKLGITRVQLSRVLNEKAGISPDLAVRLELAGVSTARHWMALQTNFELWQAKHKNHPAVERFEVA
ncbi:MAG: addiction module HigA family antidote [Alcanivorax sp.]|jgi:addiction module HigA family antidote